MKMKKYISTEYNAFNSNMILNNIPYIGKFIRDFKNYAKGYSSATTTIDNPHLIVNLFLNRLTSLFNNGVFTGKDKIDLTLGYKKYIINVKSVKFKDKEKLKLAQLDLKLYKGVLESVIKEEICKPINNRTMTKEELNGILIWDSKKVEEEVNGAIEYKNKVLEELEDDKLSREWDKFYEDLVDISFDLLKYLNDNIKIDK